MVTASSRGASTKAGNTVPKAKNDAGQRVVCHRLSSDPHGGLQRQRTGGQPSLLPGGGRGWQLDSSCEEIYVNRKTSADRTSSKLFDYLAVDIKSDLIPYTSNPNRDYASGRKAPYRKRKRLVGIKSIECTILFIVIKDLLLITSESIYSSHLFRSRKTFIQSERLVPSMREHIRSCTYRGRATNQCPHC